MRPALLLVACGVAALVVGGCTGGNDDPTRSDLAVGLGELCDETRFAVEALGAPQDVGASVFRAWAQVGRAFVADVRGLPTRDAEERRRLTSLAGYFAGFYANLELGYQLYRDQQSTAIKQVLERGYALLASAERIADDLGATECAHRPFADT